MAANITFGNFPADMSDPVSWGYDEFLSDQDPVLSATPTPTLVQLTDPVTGTRLQLTGSFDLSGLLQGNFTTSTVSSALVNVATGGLLIQGSVDPPLSLAPFFADDVDFFPLLTTGDDSIRGGTGNDILDGGTGTDTAVFGGTRSEYSIQSSGSTLIVSGGSDGSDTLSAFEILKFADQTISLVQPPLDHPPDYGQDIGFLFDEVYYLLANPDLVGTVTPENALDHYLGGGAAEGRDPNSWFDPEYYSNRWADLKALDLDEATLFMHYNLYGVWEGRSAGPAFDQFDGERYLSDWPDVAAYVDANVDDFLGSRSNGAIAHFVIYGDNEQRLAYDMSGTLIDLGFVL
jgi:hypothetical protein